MKIRMFALPGGRIEVFVDEGTFEEAKMATEAIFQRMQANGLPVELNGKIEQHRDDVTHVHVHHDVNQQQ